MGMDRVQVDASAFEKLVGAALQGDIAAGRAAVDEIAMVHDGSARAQRIVQLARKRVRGVVDQDRPVADVLPVPGLMVGSTIARPIADADADTPVPA